MNTPIYRIKEYLLAVGEGLRLEHKKARLFKNSADIGDSRENIFKEFLENHLPISCQVQKGGSLFGLNGTESRQIDIIVSSIFTINFPLSSTIDKIMTCVDGTLGVICIKSFLGKNELIDSLNNIHSIPQKTDGMISVNPLIDPKSSEELPFKMIYAADGMEIEPMMQILENFYKNDPTLIGPSSPTLIYVSGKYHVIRTGRSGSRNRQGDVIPAFQFYGVKDPSDVHPLMYCIEQLNTASQYFNTCFINYSLLRNVLPS